MCIFPRQTLNCFSQLTSSKVFYTILFRKMKAEKEDLISTHNQLSSDLERLLNQREVQCQGLQDLNVLFCIDTVSKKIENYDLWYGIIVMALRITSTPELWEISLINNTEKVVWIWTMEAQGNLREPIEMRKNCYPLIW